MLSSAIIKQFILHLFYLEQCAMSYKMHVLMYIFLFTVYIGLSVIVCFALEIRTKANKRDTLNQNTRFGIGVS